MSSRLDFDERRARALEGVVQYRPGAVPPLQPPTGQEQGRRDHGRRDQRPATRAAAISGRIADRAGQQRRAIGTARRQAPARSGAAEQGPRDAAPREAQAPASGRRAAQPPRQERRARRPDANALDNDGNERRARRRAPSRPRAVRGDRPEADGRDGRPGEPTEDAIDRRTRHDPTRGRPASIEPARRRASARRSTRPSAIDRMPRAAIGRPRRGRRRHAGAGADGARRRRAPSRIVKLAVVVQRYGADINGGAELHARYIAERLSRHADGRSRDDLRARLRDVEERAAAGRRAGQRRHRAPLPGRARARSRDDFGRRSVAVFEHDALARRRARAGSRAKGRRARRWCDYVEQAATALDFVLLFSYRYYHAWHVRAAASRTRRSSCRRRSAIRRSAWRSSARSSAACARSCTTRRKSAR